MPFSTNNVDITVNANVLFGVSSLLLYHQDADKLFDQELRKIYRDIV